MESETSKLEIVAAVTTPKYQSTAMTPPRKYANQMIPAHFGYHFHKPQYYNDDTTISRADNFATARNRYGKKVPQGVYYPSHHHVKQCINCNDIGHLYRQCPKPLVSYGILLFRKREDDGNLEYVVICRRHSFGFIEIMRGHFELIDRKYIDNLILEMTEYEREILLNCPFEWLWDYLWVQPKDDNKFDREFHETKEKLVPLLKSESFRRSLLDLPNQWKEPEWGFPKGRRDKNESALFCARREMMEETGISQTSYNLMTDISTVKETFRGTDNRLYSHLYYVAQVKAALPLTVEVDKSNVHQMREISKVKWATFDEIKKLFRPYNSEKLEMIRSLDERLKERLQFLESPL